MKQVSIVLVAALVGITAGLGLYTFVYARGYSYLTDNPQACANCHVMQEYYDAWVKSPHHAVAVCNDCHTPHNFFGKYATKTENGFGHSFAFTSGWYSDNIMIEDSDESVTESTCRSCHEQITTAIAGPHNSKTISCIRCHFDVGHSAASFVVSTHESSLETNSNGEQH